MRFITDFKDALKEHIPLFLCVLFALFVGLIAQFYFETGDETLFIPRYLPEFMAIFICAPVPIMVIRFFESLVKRHPYAELKHNVLGVVSVQNIIRVMICFCSVYVAISIFSTVKSQIGLYLTPHGHDILFMEIERFIHGGRLPHEYFDIFFDHPEYRLLNKIDTLYSAWFFVLYVYLAWIVFQPPGTPGRMRYMVSFVLCWSILGNILAAVGASAGPVFWEYFVEAPNPYTEFLNNIDAVQAQEPLFRTQFRDYMLWLVNNDKIVDINGPAAMPSVHVGIATLFFMHSMRYLPALVVPSFLFLLCIMVGSFMLAWHYAIDGYVAIAAMALIWFAAGRWVEKEKAV